MALFHYHASVIQRKRGSAVACAAYQSGQRLTDQRTGITHDYRRRKHMAYAAIYAPDQAPKWVYDRNRLWGEIEAVNRRADSQLGFKTEMSLPVELSIDQWLPLIEAFIRPWVERGQVVDIAIHTPQGNPHAHILSSTNEIGAEVFGKKRRDLSPDFRYGRASNTDGIQDERKRWADLCNRALIDAGHPEAAVLHSGTLAEQGIDREPTQHEGRWRHIKNRTGGVSIDTPEVQQARTELTRIADEQDKIHHFLKSFEAEVQHDRDELAQITGKPSAAPPNSAPCVVGDAAAQSRPTNPNHKEPKKMLMMILRMILRALFHRPNGYGFMSPDEFGAMFPTPRPTPRRGMGAAMRPTPAATIDWGMI